ncbi:GmrSD restriction endonuclease domain-containing protein [Brachybacterium sp. AOP42-C2-15]|uniref:GmrSD restriction endonuclease domain-containing protein n=1 Tax=Brachybacterium sp. AOP42-C2-15 TaxID=3457670 RepID=UPI004034663A
MSASSPDRNAMLPAAPCTTPTPGLRSRGTSTETVQVNHIVPLAGAWYSGAEQWSAQERERFANDPGTLVTVAAATNG